MNKFIRIFIKGSSTYVDIPLMDGDTMPNRMAQARMEGAICSPTAFVPYDSILWAVEISPPSQQQGGKLN